MERLVMEDGEQWGAWLESEQGLKVPLRGYCRLGRAPDNHIVIEGHKASRHHAAIHAQDEGQFLILDMGSRNGTFLNDHRVIRPTQLQDGARIMLAGATFRFRQPAGGATRQETSAPNVTVTEFKHQKAWLLMTDIVGFTELSQDLPTESLAVAVGRWFHQGQRLVEKRNGRISKYLGDGFLACWEPAGETAEAVANALRDFHELLLKGDVKFRVVLHHGVVTFGGATDFGEEMMIGPELNYVFRMEKLAGKLKSTFCLSAAAQSALADSFPTKPIPGEYELKGFPGLHRCFEIDWQRGAAEILH